ncbi:TonB-dependent receptor [Echinicola soli]|uniref:TonB-dependent receptor n=2 Tax=Echinicola soli TaxID=2591634 RepID=A0A514CP56_9BACT|nr:TonB-dependent receptor [Echinicola soli]
MVVQERSVEGKVVDHRTGEPLPGATILVKGTDRGTITDLDGNFSIKLPDGHRKLLISFIGYMSHEVQVGNQEFLNVQLEPDAAALDEVVVIGYGEVDKKDLTGSVASMDSEEIKKTNKVNAFQSLQGQLPGVDIQSTGNKPGDGFNIRIRGNNTINSNVSDAGYSPGQNPLFIVDGVFVTDISFINPTDIERMDVLKDASATAIYGARGSSGVVIITTKTGSKGEVNYQYDNYIGFRQAYNTPRIFEGEEFVQFFKDAAVGTRHATGNLDYGQEDVVLSDYLRPNELKNIREGNYVNWPDLIQQNGLQMNHTLSASGGTDKVVYGFGFGYTRDEGTFPGEDLERFNLRSNLTFNISKYLSFDYSGYLTHSIRNLGSQEGFRSAYRLRPTGDAYDDQGNLKFFPIDGETFITNPLFEPSGILEEFKNLNFIGNFGITLKPIEGLKIVSRYSPNLFYERYGQFRGINTKSSSMDPARRRAYWNTSNLYSYTWDNILTYGHNFNDRHQVDLTLISSSWMDRYELHETEVRNFNTDEFLFYNQGIASDIRKLDNSLTKETIQSFTGRINYILDDKYVFTATGRYDGASKLSAKNKWAFFPSAAFAWRIGDEDFMKSQQVVSDLKVRLSYGQTGNTGTGGGLRPLGSQSNIGFGFTNLGDQPTRTAYVTNLANQDLTWERTSEVNLGIDFGLLGNRIYGSIDLYDRNTSDLILYRNLPIVSGHGGVFENVGEVRNRGIELALNSVNIDKGGFKWTTSLNFATNHNELTSLYGGLEELPPFANHIHRVGEPVGSVYTYQADGIWQTHELEEAREMGQQPGQVRVKDLDDDGVITEADRTTIGSVQPDWTGGITNTFNYKGFDLSFFVFTRQGVTSGSWFHRSHAWDGDRSPARFNGLKTNYWTPDNPSQEWFQPGNGGPYQEVVVFQDVSFVKVGYITLGHTFKTDFINKLGVKSLRLYATAQNPFIFTPYEGWDPETADRNTYRAAFLSRSFLGGLNIQF